MNIKKNALTVLLTGTFILAAPALAQPGRQGGTATGIDPRAASNVIVVAQAGGNATSIREALELASDAGQPDANGDPIRYLIAVAPGTYRERVTMRPYVDVEGAGEGLTEIVAGGGLARNATAATVVGADHSELRGLTVRNTGGSVHAIGVYNNQTSPRLGRVTIAVAGGKYNYGVVNSSASPSLFDVEVEVIGDQATAPVNSFGVHSTNSSPTLSNVTLSVGSTSGGNSGNYGLWNSGSSMVVRESTVAATGAAGANQAIHDAAGTSLLVYGSVLVGDSAAVFNDQAGTSSWARVAHSQLIGAMDGEVMNCVGAFDSGFEALTEECGQP